MTHKRIRCTSRTIWPIEYKYIYIKNKRSSKWIWIVYTPFISLYKIGNTAQRSIINWKCRLYSSEAIFGAVSSRAKHKGHTRTSFLQSTALVFHFFYPPLAHSRATTLSVGPHAWLPHAGGRSGRHSASPSAVLVLPAVFCWRCGAVSAKPARFERSICRRLAIWAYNAYIMGIRMALWVNVR